MKRTLEKTAILSLSLILISTYSVSSVIPMMVKYFSGYSTAAVEQLIPITSFAIMIMILLNTWLSKVISERTSIILGMILIAGAGTVPVFIQQYEVMFAARVLLGVGIGLVNAYALHMINERYEGEERASLLGYRAAMEGLGSAVLTLIAGWLLQFGWNYAFWIYVAALPILILYLCFVPKQKNRAEKEVREESTERIQKEGSLRDFSGVLVSSLLLGGLAICVNSANSLRIPGLVLERGMGTESQASVVLSGMLVASIVGGVFFGRLNQVLKENMTAACLLADGIGLILIVSAPNIWILGLGAMISGAAQNLIVTSQFNHVSDRLPENFVKYGTTFVLVGCNLGSSCSALLLKVIGSFSTAAGAPFVTYAAILVILALLMLCGGRFSRRNAG